jgi:uncharacterized protein (DUF305 family)
MTYRMALPAVPGAAAMAVMAVMAVMAALLLGGCGGDEPAAQPEPRFNQVDADFIPAMNQLLSQADVFGEAAEQHAASAQVKELAEAMNAVHDAQFERLVALMDELARQEDLEAVHDHGDNAHTIPGYIDEADMDRLTQAKGPAFDRAFRVLVIQHHDGAIELARTEQAQGSHQPTKDLARQIEASLSDHKRKLARLGA